MKNSNEELLTLAIDVCEVPTLVEKLTLIVGVEMDISFSVVKVVFGVEVELNMPRY